MVSHELRTPLTSILLQLDALERDGEPLPEAKRPLVQRMARAATRLRDLVDSLLEYALIQSGKLAIRVTPFDVVAVAEEAIEDVRAHAEAKQLALALEVASGRPVPVPPLSSDPRMVRLILVNLLGNAIKFTATGGVTVLVSYERGAHQLAVRDTGSGIPEDERARIFEPFEQLEPVRAKHTVGVGLGLALVREMVGALGGVIEIDSAPGRGSTFTVRLPPLSTHDGRTREHGRSAALS